MIMPQRIAMPELHWGRLATPAVWLVRLVRLILIVLSCRIELLARGSFPAVPDGAVHGFGNQVFWYDLLSRRWRRLPWRIHARGMA